MKIKLLSIVGSCLFFLSSNLLFGQFSKQDIEQIFNNYNITEFHHIKISISSAEKTIGEMRYFNIITTKDLKIEYKENYIIVTNNPKRKYHIPYSNIKAISNFPKEENGIYKHITIFLND